MKKTILILTVLIMTLLTACGKSISAEEAKKIAFSDAGVTAQEVTITKEKQDGGDFELGFQTADTAYEYEIRKNGSIDSKEREMIPGAAADTPEATPTVTDEVTEEPGTADNNTEAQAPSDTDSNKISEDEAQAIALERAGLTKDQIQFYEIKQDMENGVLVYEIEFYQDRTEYSVDVDAATGEITKFETDVD